MQRLATGPRYVTGLRRLMPRHPILPLLLFVAPLAIFGFAPAAYAQGDAQPPIVIGLSPLPGAISQDVTTAVTASFSEAIQPASVAFVLKDSAGVIVPASVTYDSSTNTATLRPSSDLAAARTYTATLSAATDLAGNAMINPSVWSFSTGQPGFRESVIFSGLQDPTAFQFAADGRVFVAEKSGLILIFDNLTDGTPSVFADIRTAVDSSGNRGLLGLALDPGFPAVPYVYVFYSYAVGSGGVAQGRVSRFQATGNVQTGAEQVLVNDWYQRYPDQSVGNLAFGPDGNLYAAAGDGASAALVDVGQTDSPSPDPANEGGALRSQDLRTPADPVTLDGSVIRINPNTGQAVRATTSMTVGAPTVDANGVKSYPVTSVYQGSQPQVVRVLEPTNPAPGRPRRLLYVLPVSAGVTNQGSQFGDGLEELRLLDVANRFNLTLIAPSFAYEPWYGDNVTDPTLWMETFIVRELVPWGDTFLPAGTTPQRLLIGFSKSGNGALILIFRHPNVFSAAAAWDSPAQLNDVGAFSGLPLNFGTQANYNRYFLPTLVTAGAQKFTGSNRLWISGDQSSWTADMIQFHGQLTAAGIPHTWVAGGTRAHSWSSGWLNGAVTALDANAAQLPAADTNEPRIIAYGLRSPRIAVRPGSQELWVADRGSSTEEINRIPNAADGNVENFAWPCYEAGVSTAYSGTSICSALQSQPAQLTAPFFSYLNQQQVVAGNEGGVGSGAISGLAFYGAGSYPANYQGSLFFADRARNNIWVMFKDANGNPNPGNIANFVLGAASPADLETGPGGDLFYADQNGGTIRRIRFVEPIGRSGGQPSGILAAGTTQTLVTLATDQNAICRYATTAGVSYGSMPNAFATTGGTTHSTLVTGLVNGGVYTLFVRCATSTGDRNPDDYPISFSVGRPPAITSVNTTTFTVVTPVTFLVTATGTPTPSLTETGTLPSGVTFHDNGNGTATLSGPAAGGTAGVYPITITASNGGGAPATQNFTLTVSAGSGGGPANFTYVAGSVTGVVDFGGDTAATLAIPLHQSPGTGHLLICAATWQSPTATASMSDPNNGTWISIGTARAGVGNLATYRGQMFYTPAAVSAPTTVTLTISAAVGFRAFECAEYLVQRNPGLSGWDATVQHDPSVGWRRHRQWTDHDEFERAVVRSLSRRGFDLLRRDGIHGARRHQHIVQGPRRDGTEFPERNRPADRAQGRRRCRRASRDLPHRHQRSRHSRTGGRDGERSDVSHHHQRQHRVVDRRVGRQLHDHYGRHADALPDGNRAAAERRDVREQRERDRNSQRNAGRRNGRELRAHDYGEQRRRNAGHPDPDADGQPDAGDHERHEHDVHGDVCQQLHGHDERHADSHRDENGRTAERCDVRRQRERDRDPERDTGGRKRGQLPTHDHGEQWYRDARHPELHPDGQPGAGHHERGQHDVYDRHRRQLQRHGDGNADTDHHSDRRASHWCDVRQQREWDRDAEWHAGRGNRRQLCDLDHGEQRRGDVGRAELYADGQRPSTANDYQSCQHDLYGRSAREFPGHRNWNADTVARGSGRAPDRSDLRRQRQRHGDVERHTGGRNRRQLCDHDHGEQRRRHAGDAELHAGGQPGAGHHECRQRHIHRGRSPNRLYHHDGDTVAFSVRDRTAAKWRDVRQQRERHGHAEWDGGRGDDRQLSDHDHGKQRRRHAGDAKLYVDREPGACDHERVQYHVHGRRRGQLHRHDDRHTDAVGDEHGRSSERSHVRQQRERDGDAERDGGRRDGRQLSDHDHGKQRRRDAGHAKLHADGQPGAGDHERGRSHLRDGCRWNLHRHGEWRTDAVSDGNGRAAERSDVRRQRERHGDVERNAGGGDRGQLRDHDCGEQRGGNASHAELRPDGQSANGTGDHQFRRRDVHGRHPGQFRGDRHGFADAIADGDGNAPGWRGVRR